jgi:hypothetical protein
MLESSFRLEGLGSPRRVKYDGRTPWGKLTLPPGKIINHDPNRLYTSSLSVLFVLANYAAARILDI